MELGSPAECIFKALLIIREMISDLTKERAGDHVDSLGMRLIHVVARHQIIDREFANVMLGNAANGVIDDPFTQCAI